MKRPKLVRDDSGERNGWWLGDRFVPDEPPGVREWHEARRLRAALIRYGKHETNCLAGVSGRTDCSCGLSAYQQPPAEGVEPK